MAKKFSVLSWNVEHFKSNANRTDKITQRIKLYKPDIFAIYETESVEIMNLMQQQFTDYDFFITDGPEIQEILIGCKRGVFSQKIFTQKREFKAYNPALRPGALLSVKHGTNSYSLLFLHTDSGTDAGAFGNRFEMMSKVMSMSDALVKLDPASGVIVAGDLNTMGMQFPTSTKSNQRVDQDTEISGVGKLLAKNNFIIAEKQLDGTWLSTNLTTNSNLDHVIHNNNVKLNSFGNRTDGKPYFVKVEGWQQLDKAGRKKYLDELSDHCILYFEVA